MEVVVMGPSVYTNYIAAIQACVGSSVESIKSFEKKIKVLKGELELHDLEGDAICAENTQTMLLGYQNKLSETQLMVESLKMFIIRVYAQWREDNNQVIGFICWAPPIGVGVTPHGYTFDIR
jgi:hypothetical protein